MEKIKTHDWVLTVLLLLCVRACVDFSIGQALAILFLGIFVIARKYLEFLTKKEESKQKPDEIAELKRELMEVRSHVSGLMMKNTQKPQETHRGRVVW